MKKTSKKHNIILKFENMPKNILGIYINVLGKPHILLNEILHEEMHEFLFYSCLYFKEENVGKITMSDLENKNYAPFIFARERMRDCLVCWL